MCYPYLIPRKIIEKLENFRFFEAISPVRIRLENSGCLVPSPDQDYHKQSGSDFGIWDMAFSSTFRGPGFRLAWVLRSIQGHQPRQQSIQSISVPCNLISVILRRS